VSTQLNTRRGQLAVELN